MSSGCGDVLSLADLQTAKKHQIFEAEVITGKSGGVAGGADIDYATNQNTGQVQKTMPAILRDIGFEPASFDFTTGGTLISSDRNKAVLWPLADGGDGDWYYWEGALPKVIPAASSPSSTGGIAEGAWRPVGDITLRAELEASSGADIVGFQQAGVGSVARTAQAKMREHISPLDFGAVGDGVTDDSAKMQAAVNAIAGAAGVIDLSGASYAITTVSIPNGKQITIRNGSINVIGAGLGFSKTTLVPAPPAGDLIFEGVRFSRVVSGGACVHINLAWQDATGGVIIKSDCMFTLLNGAVGVRLSRSFGNSISGRYNMDATSTAILCDASEVVAADAYPSCPMETIVDTAFFEGGIAFDQVFVNGSTWNSFEGFSFGPGCRFYASKFFAKKYNSLKINGVHGVSWNAVLDSGINTSITGGYYDRQTANDWLFKFLTTIRGSQGITIGGGAALSAQSSIGDMVVFSDAGSAPGAQISNVVIGTSYWVGGINSASQAIRGLLFNHNGLRNVLVDGSQSFQMMYACMSFVQPISRSLIKAFDARDITLYSENTAYGFGDPLTHFNRFDGIYRVYTVEVWVPTYIASAVSETIHKQTITFDNMMRAPISVVSNITEPFGAGFFTITTPLTYRNAVEVDLIKNPSAPGNTRGGAGATITLDASVYIAPL